MKNIVDLHTHTTKSDGTYTPNELLMEAESKGLKILSITDHECVDAYFDIDTKLFSGKIIPGIELRTSCFGVAIELLAYGFDIKKMKETIEKFHYKNTKELDEYMIHLAYIQYNERGIKLDNDFIETYNSEIYPRFSKYLYASVKKHIENQELLKELPEGKSFFRYCMTNPKSPFFLDLSSAFPTIKELVNAIKNASGFISIPHIFEYKDNAEKILKHLIENYNIDAIECFYPSFTKEQTEYLLEICKKYNKFSSGGSDFHGAVRPKTELGRGENNNLFVPIEKVEEWINKISKFKN